MYQTPIHKIIKQLAKNANTYFNHIPYDITNIIVQTIKYYETYTAFIVYSHYGQINKVEGPFTREEYIAYLINNEDGDCDDDDVFYTKIIYFDNAIIDNSYYEIDGGFSILACIGIRLNAIVEPSVIIFNKHSEDIIGYDGPFNETQFIENETMSFDRSTVLEHEIITSKREFSSAISGNIVDGLGYAIVAYPLV